MHSRELVDNFASLWENGQSKSGDVSFVFESKQTLSAHKLILSARSPVFAAMFSYANTKEAQENQVEITDISAEVFQQLLKYIYTGRVDSQDHRRHAEGLLAAADKYGLIKLKQYCEQCLITQLSLESALRLLPLAEMHCAIELKVKALKMIKK